ncbi:ganglioside GM2 activator-like [Myxocyprinus asiaticus]|uniref:ganglioside GM2 activator-like n=1 Tax=Myxocyprinus asiaticus TaxID=70543 RepID=UPI002221E2A7|nr:ganglioside GM2 activator-like [Myxocyprinus asiaticus]
MKSCISVFLALFATNVFWKGDSHSMKSSKLTKVRGFSWENCGKPDDPAFLKTLNLYPDPIPSPGYLIASASGSILADLTSPLSVNMTVEREVDGVWVKIPCKDDLGSCDYPNICKLLDQLFPPRQCPDPLQKYCLPCHCPFKEDDYDLPSSAMYIPNYGLPDRLTNYRVQGILRSSGKELGCLKVSLSIASILYK